MTRLGRLTTSAGAVAAGLAIVWLYGSCQRAAGAREAELVLREQALADSTRWADSLEVLRRAADSVARAQDAALQRRSAYLVTVATAARRRADSLTALLRPLVPDSAQALVDAIGEACAAAVAAVDSAWVLERERVANCQLRLAAADSAVQRWRGLAASWEATAGAWRRRAQPGIFTRIWRGLPWLLAGAVVWELGR